MKWLYNKLRAHLNRVDPQPFTTAERAAAQFQGMTVRPVDQIGWRELPSEWSKRMEAMQPPVEWHKHPEFFDAKNKVFCDCTFRCTCCGRLVNFNGRSNPPFG